LTVISLGDEIELVEEKWLERTIIRYKEVDDVFREEFLNGVLFTSRKTIEITAGAKELLGTKGTSWIEMLNVTTGTSCPKPGPYYISGRQLFEIWELQDDSHGAFLNSLVPGAGGYVPMPI
jgi:hypothetical protein